MNKEELTRKIMEGLKESLNESKALDLKTNKDHKAAYNSFVKWYNRWKEKLGREEIRALVKKVTNDALGDNLDMINESGYNIKLDDGTSIYHSDPTSQIEDLKTNGKVWVAIKGTNDRATKIFQQDNQEFLAACKKLGLQVSGNVERKDINGNIHKLYTLNESKQLYEWGKPGAADEALAEDLALTFRNTYELWEKNAMWMVNALLKRLRKGQPVLEEHLANSGSMNVFARAAIEEYCKDYPHTYVSTATRKLLKQKIAHEIFEYAMDEWEYEQNNE